MNKNEIFVIGSWIDSRVKEQNLIEIIKDLKSKDYPVCLVSHFPVSENIQELADYYIYEKENVLGDFRLTFWRIINGVKQEKQSNADYHGVACLMNILNAIDLLVAKGKYKYVHYREADITYDFDKYMETFRKMISENKQAFFVHYQDNAYRTDLFSCDINWFDHIIPEPQSWEEYKKLAISGNVILEYWFTEWVRKNTEEDQIIFIKDFKVGNKWTHSQTCVDWDDDPRPKLDFADAPITTEQKDAFTKVLGLLYKNKVELNPNIVEIGVTKQEGIKDTTSIWAWYVSKYGGSYHGCDADKEALMVAGNCFKKYMVENNKVKNAALTKKEDIIFLSEYITPTDLLYLTTVNLQLLFSATHMLKIGGYIMFDKESLNADIVVSYLLGSNNFTCIHKGNQFIFRKDI